MLTREDNELITRAGPGTRDAPIVIVDGFAGRVIVDPTAATLRDYEDRRSAYRRETRRFARLRHLAAVTRDDTVLAAVEATDVTFVALDALRIAWYVDTGESDDKAGSYGVQGVGSRFIERIDGSYTNVVGLPITLVDRFVRQFEAGLLVSATR